MSSGPLHECCQLRPKVQIAHALGVINIHRLNYNVEKCKKKNNNLRNHVANSLYIYCVTMLSGHLHKSCHYDVPRSKLAFALIDL